MRISLSKHRLISEVQQEFSTRYPFLKLEFYRKENADPCSAARFHLQDTALLEAAGLRKEGVIETGDEMTVAELERTFLKNFGLRAQVSRKSGLLWLETTMTDNWSLYKQNEHGREISLSAGALPRVKSHH